MKSTEECAPGSWMFPAEVLVPVLPVQMELDCCFLGTLGLKHTETYSSILGTVLAHVHQVANRILPKNCWMY